MSDEDDWRAQFEKLGVNQVRSKLYEWSGKLHMCALQWLAEKDRELAAAEEASRREQIDLARDASASARLSADAARTSNKIAISALIAAIVAIIISVIGMFLKH